MTLTRRTFLSRSAMTTAGVALGQSLMARRLLAATTSVSTYKSLICIDLDGGNDGNNTVVPLASSTYAKYAQARQQLALSQSSLLPIGDGQGGAYGLHPSLTNIQRLYSQGHAAVVANVGPLVTPLTREAFLAGTTPVPTLLLDHEVQRLQWGTSNAQVSTVSTIPSGWGGRVADVLNSHSTLGFPVLTSLIGADPFAPGDQSTPASVSTTGTGSFPTDNTFDELQVVASLDTDSVLIGAARGGLKDALNQQSFLASALQGAPPFKTVFPTSALGQQLRQVATMMSVNAALGTDRQIFLCKQMGFDLHGSLLTPHASLLADLDASIAAFVNCMEELGMMNQFTIFTQSDFGRALGMNSSAGADHAWGNHQLVVGGQVAGNRLYGMFPDLTLGGPDDLTQDGRWIPSSSIEQYCSPLALWFGVPSNKLSQVFPNAAAFKPGTLPFFG